MEEKNPVYRRALNFASTANFEAALPLLEALARNNPTTALYKSDLGAVLFQLGHVEEAETQLLNAFELAPNSEYVIRNLFEMILATEGKSSPALRLIIQRIESNAHLRDELQARLAEPTH